MSDCTDRPDTFVPACGGTENVFVIDGRSWLYAYHPYSGRHCYLDVDNKKPIWNRSFHPTFHPDFEYDADPADAIAYPSRVRSDEIEDFYW